MKMKILPIIMLAITLTTTTLTLKTQTEKANCLPANSMWTEPQTLSFNTTTTPIGYKFNITIYANLSVASYAWQIYLTYNKNHLQATGCWYSKGSKSEWAGTRPTSPQTPSYGSHNATHNYVLFAEIPAGRRSNTSRQIQPSHNRIPNNSPTGPRPNWLRNLTSKNFKQLDNNKPNI
jgi:hypothetical protein